MRPNLDSTLAAALPKPLVLPAYLAEITLKSGKQYVWSGVGPLEWNGQTWTGVGELGHVGEIAETASLEASGTTITLNGIGLSQIGVPDLGVTPPDPPRATVTGESVLWSLPSAPPIPGTVSVPADLFNGFWGVSGTAGQTGPNFTDGGVSLQGGDPIEDTGITVPWVAFGPPAGLPPGAVVTGVYPVVRVIGATIGGFMNLVTGSGSASPTVGVHAFNDVGTWLGQTIYVTMFNSLEPVSEADGGTEPATFTAQMDFVGFAVYFMGTPLSYETLMYEALNDVYQGAPAKIYFALWDGSANALLGTPYLVFDGSVDKVSAKLASVGASITLNLESKMIDLQRASNRKFTAADQHIYYPDDMGFNFVEILQLISLKEGN